VFLQHPLKKDLNKKQHQLVLLGQILADLRVDHNVHSFTRPFRVIVILTHVTLGHRDSEPLLVTVLYEFLLLWFVY
jgi:hypothetical protein